MSAWIPLQEAFDRLGQRMFPGEWEGHRTVGVLAPADPFGESWRRTGETQQWHVEANANKNDQNAYARKETVLQALRNLMKDCEVAARFIDIQAGDEQAIPSVRWCGVDFSANPASGMGGQGNAIAMIEINAAQLGKAINATYKNAPMKRPLPETDMKAALEERHKELDALGAERNKREDDEAWLRERFPGRSISRDWLENFRRKSLIAAKWRARGRKKKK